MIRKKDIKDERNQVSILHDLVESYGQIASIRMKKIRKSVLSNREFFSSISEIFNETLNEYTKRAILKKGYTTKDPSKVTFLAHNGKTVAVFVSANTGFYGEVVQSVFRKFIEDVFGNPEYEVTVIGRIGRSLFSQSMPDKPYTYFELPDFGINKEKIAEVIHHLVAYEEVKIYYGQYKSVVKQVPVVDSMTAGTTIEKTQPKKQLSYIFEPTIDDILMFFETEIFASFFDQSIRESQLAKLASRIVSMDKATQNIKDRIKNLEVEELKMSHKEIAKKQLELTSTLVGRSW